MNIVAYRCVVIAVGVATMCSCAHVPQSQRYLSAGIPEHYTSNAAGRAYSDRWWTGFSDERLDKLVKEALAGNFGLQQVRQRLVQADALARKAGAERMPTASIDGSAAHSRAPQLDSEGAKSIQSVDQFGLNLAASYEIDLWGRVGATKRAAALDAETARDNLDTAAMTLVAQIADVWYELVALQERASLLAGQVESHDAQVRLLELRFKTGQVTALDVLQQREQLAALRALLPRIEALLVTTRHQLAVLLGRSPQMTDDLVPSSWPELPPLPETGVPADLLQKRPDVRAAITALRASDERAAAALADRLPSLRLTASAGYSASDTGVLFDDLLSNIAGNLLMPVLDGGRRRAESDRARAVSSESLARCGDVILNAVREVEDALVNEEKQKETFECQVEQREAASEHLQQVLSRYQRGLSDYLPVLNAQVREQSVARTLVDTRRGLISYRIQLHRALGGYWMRTEVSEAALREGEDKDE